MNWTFLSCKKLCLIYVWFMIVDLLHCLNFDRTMNWFSIPANIYFAIVATIVCISSGEPKFSTWFLTCTFSSENAFLAICCLIYVWFRIANFLANFVRSMHWFSIPANIYFAIVATIVCISSGEPNFSTWFLTCTFSSENAFLANFVWFMFDLGLWTCTVNHEWLIL